MARELRFERLINSATAAENAATEFRNDSAGIIHIREISQVVRVTAASPDEVAIVEVSKAPAAQAETNNSPFYCSSVMICAGMGDGATAYNAAGDGTNMIIKIQRYGKGQLTLEPGESLFQNVSSISTGPTVLHHVEIGYEFG